MGGNLEEETIKLILNNRKLYEMANIHPEVSGIKAMLYSTFGGAKMYKHRTKSKSTNKKLWYGTCTIT